MNTHRLFLGLLVLTASAAQAQFNYITNDGIAIITGYTGPSGPVAIPSTLGGLPVTVIEGSGFEDTGITSVAISASVTNIQAQEFAPNDSLTSFTVDSNNPAYSSTNGVLYNKNGTTLFEYPPGISGSYTIPGTVSNIGPNAFAACYFLSAVTIPDSVTNIGDAGFGYCFALTNITIPDSVTILAPDAFINCEHLSAITVAAGNSNYSSVGGVLFDKNVTTLLEFPTGLTGSYTIPNGVTTIAADAFILCDGLTNISMPPSVTSIEDGAFGDCLGLTNITLGAGVNNLSTSAFAGSDILLAINVNPSNSFLSSLDGVVFNKNQTTLIQFPNGFKGGYTVPNSVTSIAPYAFEDCELTDVTISSNVTTIGLESFQGCGELTNVTMLGGVVSIGVFAFADSPELATVNIPASVTDIATYAFAYDGLTSVYFEGNAPTSDAPFLGDSATIYYLAGTSGWGPTYDGLTTVIENAPNPNGSLEVTIQPPGAVSSGAQWQVDGGLIQPGGATVLGLSVGTHTVSFLPASGWMAPSNQMVSVGAGETNSITGTYTEQAAPSSDFIFVTNDGTITITGYIGPGGTVLIPSTINGLPMTSLGQQAFANISTVTSVAIPDSVTNIGELAFSSCSALADITISAGVSNIQFGMFEDCFSLSEVTFRGDVTNFGDYAFASCPDLVSLTIPNTLTSLGQYAFFGGGLTNVTIPAGLTNIGEAAFLFCNVLPAITVDPANPAYASVSGVLLNKTLTELVEYPDGKPGAAYAISNSVTSIGNAAFEYCDLTNITIPTSVTNIGNYSFGNSSSLTSVIIPDSVTSIGEEAFAACVALTSIALPGSVTNLGAIPFANCANMTAITVAAGNPDFSGVNGVLYNKTGTQLIEYPGGLPGSFTVPNDVQDIGSQAFEECPITSVVIPASVTNIETLCFFDCLDLNSVALTEGLAAIGVAAFEDCSALSNFMLPASLTSIGSAAFYDCGMTTVIVPSAAKSVGDYAFAYCSSLTAAYFEGNALPDDSTIFVGDSNAKAYYLPGATGWGLTFGTAPTKELAGIAITAHPSNGFAPLAVNFTAAAVDSASNPVVNWNWDFGDGSTSASRNPSHDYVAFGAFTAAVVETNSMGVPIAGEATSIMVTPVPVYLGLVENGGFETGDFTGWDLFGGDTKDNFVTNTINGVSAYSGTYFVVLGSFGTNLTYLSQTLATTVGEPYLLSLWLDSPDGLGPNEFLVSWNGVTLFNETNIPALGWTNLQFMVSATATNTVLEFGFRDDPSFLGLDEISVYPEQPSLTGASLAGANLVLDGSSGQAGVTYIVLTSTNLALPLSQWTPAATNLLSASGNFTVTVSNTVSADVPHRFYVLQTK
jgi:BspA type Leucine rich repeat region (6 copies)/PKD domain